MTGYVSKRELADRLGVSPRCVDNWVKLGRLPEPMKLGTTQQARVRWHSEQLSDLDARLRGFAA